MRLFVLYDLPTSSAESRKQAYRFRKFLLRDGYVMYQYSIYIRICNNEHTAATHLKRLKENLPSGGLVRAFVMTEAQFKRIETLVSGKSEAEHDIDWYQFTIF